MNKKSTTIKTYNNSAKALAEKYDTMESRVGDIEETLQLLNKENPTVLEIGCGSGRDAEEILKLTNQYIGMDVSKELIKFAKEKNPHGVFIIADIEEYTFPKKIDIIFAFASLLHISKDGLQKVLSKGLKSLNPGGVFRISLKHNDKYLETTVDDAFGTRTFYLYSEDDMKECATGYNIQKIYLNKITSQETTWLEVILQKPN